MSTYSNLPILRWCKGWPGFPDGEMYSRDNIGISVHCNRNASINYQANHMVKDTIYRAYSRSTISIEYLLDQSLISEEKLALILMGDTTPHFISTIEDDTWIDEV